MELRYFGSVRFFKHLILLTVCILIAVPTVLSIVYGRKCTQLNTELESSEAALQEAKQDLETLKHHDIDPEAPAYQQLYPDFYAPQNLVADQVEDKCIYLTFDDGPSARTPEILQILQEENVKATFFVIGKTDEQSLQWMRDIAEQGHTIGMHTYSHQYEDIYESVESFLDDLYQDFCLIRDTTGITPTAFRFPGGSINGYNYRISQQLIAEMLRRGFVPFDWNISSGDAAGSVVPSEKILENVAGSSNVNRGIILMHDSSYKTSTVEALRPMIRSLQEKGFSFSGIQPETKPILFYYQH